LVLVTNQPERESQRATTASNGDRALVVAAQCNPAAEMPRDLLARADFIVAAAEASRSAEFDAAASTTDEMAAAIAMFLRLTTNQPAVIEMRRSLPLMTDFVPFDVESGYDITQVVKAIVDDGDFLSVGSQGSVLLSLASIGGRSLGVIASRPDVNRGILGTLDCLAIERFINTCSRAAVPLVTFVDTAGWSPSNEADTAEALHAARRSLEAIHAYPYPLISVVIGRAYGVGAAILGAVNARADFVTAWPRARFAATDINGSFVPPDLSQDANTSTSALGAGRDGAVVDIIEPDRTRSVLLDLLDQLDHRPNRSDAPLE
jgi:acetyl-CoA carboxylase carboxyltransferase component